MSNFDPTTAKVFSEQATQHPDPSQENAVKINTINEKRAIIMRTSAASS